MLKIKVSLFVLFALGQDFHWGYQDSCLSAQPVIDEGIGVVVGVKPYGIITPSGHAKKRSGHGGASGLTFRAAYIQIGNFIRKQLDESDDRFGMDILKCTGDPWILNVKKTHHKLVSGVIVHVSVLTAGTYYDGVSFLRKIEREIIVLRIKGRDGQDVDRKFLDFVHEKIVFV